MRRASRWLAGHGLESDPSSQTGSAIGTWAGVGVDPDAERVLQAAGLPTLTHRPLSSAVGLEQLPPVVYVRAPHPQRSPGLMSRDQLIALASSRDVSSLSIVDYLPSIGGAAYLSHGSVALVELVVGHLSGLLIHGMLRARYLLGEDGRVRRAQVLPQPLQAAASGQLGPGGPGMSVSSLEDLALSIHGQARMSSISSNMLMEIMVAEDRCVWVDAKHYPWAIDLDAIFSSKRQLIHGSSSVACVEPAAWAIDQIPTSCSSISLNLGNRALLGHYVTYSLQRGLGGLWNHA